MEREHVINTTPPSSQQADNITPPAPTARRRYQREIENRSFQKSPGGKKHVVVVKEVEEGFINPWREMRSTVAMGWRREMKMPRV
ncbi:hypothetical protein GCK72_016466 [Caenorhabditis remanei]|uniref:Uncharacterized protein n=1 Tax=Caenorhabditis remanei TaxID=31234 RepID=A0A6A5G598_CAERE|nr:hypothetical protein GCK72_016466 [Caenorhabditis remanei]KAF1749921.1 hypothetical protein GCK72_016466 [Caenorhabditis remanei]